MPGLCRSHKALCAQTCHGRAACLRKEPRTNSIFQKGAGRRGSPQQATPQPTLRLLPKWPRGGRTRFPARQRPGRTHHRQIDVGGIQLQVDLAVDGSLRVLVVVLAHLRGRRSGHGGGGARRSGDAGAAERRSCNGLRLEEAGGGRRGSSTGFRSSTVEAGNRGDSGRERLALGESGPHL